MKQMYLIKDACCRETGSRCFFSIFFRHQIFWRRSIDQNSHNFAILWCMPL